MPGLVNPANPVDVMPAHLAKAFTAESRMESLVNTYTDGSSDRAALALNTRHYFRLTEGLALGDMQTLFNFFLGHKINPFYFYNLRETVPPFSWDPTGGNEVGRYTVVFDSGWSDVYLTPRTQVQLALREVA